jgi:hypothetical protein
MKRINLLIILTSFSLFLCLGASAQVIKGTYAIKNVETGMLIRIKDANKKDGTPLVAYSPVNWKCMTWDFNYLGGQTYQLKNLFTGKTFQPNNSPSEGTGLEQRALNVEATNQQYEFIVLNKNVYAIRLKDTDLYLTTSDKNGAINSEIILGKKDKGKLQQWTIYEQHPDF